MSNKQENQENKVEEKNKGLKAVLDKALESYEKLPMLEIVFERLVRLLTSALRNLTSETVDIKIANFTSMRFGSYFKQIKKPSSIVVFKILEWDNPALLVMDGSLVYSMLDLLFGGKKHSSEIKVENRPHTYIEQALIKQIGEVFLGELSASFDFVSPATCVFERLESNPNFATITRSGDAIIHLKLKIDLEGKGGFADIVIPYSTIDPVKPLLQQVFIGEKYGSDSGWEESMVEKIYTIDLPLQAIIEDNPRNLSNLTNLKVGDTIITSRKQDEEVEINCEGIKLFKGQIGKIEDKVAINITDRIKEEH